jgi:cell division protein FtsB
MSDIDRTRMIPLHIADQAVAACDAEIAKLRDENARLKAEVERLEKQTDYERMYRETIELLKKHNL